MLFRLMCPFDTCHSSVITIVTSAALDVTFAIYLFFHSFSSAASTIVASLIIIDLFILVWFLLSCSWLYKGECCSYNFFLHTVTLAILWYLVRWDSLRAHFTFLC